MDLSGSEEVLLMNIDQMAIQRALEEIRKYGVINLEYDQHFFRKEVAEELLDSLNYIQWVCEKNQIPLKDYRQMNRAIRAVINLIEKSCPGFAL
jgi:hypothetical protein